LYNIKLKVKGDQAHGFCPLPDHKGRKRSPSFSVNLPKGIWQCFGCSAKGNVIDFVARMEGLNPFKGKDVRQAAEILQEKLGLPSQASKGNDSVPPPADADHSSRTNLPVVVNQPLDFELQNLDPDHSYLLSRGFTPETIREFGLG
jgi:DNA primase